MTSSFSEKLTKVKNALEHVFVKKTDIKNNLTSTDTDKPLSANQGKVLNDGKVDKVSGKGLSKNDFTDTYKGKLDDLDSNLSNKANSTHTHGNLQNDGSVGTSDNVNKNVITDGNGKITTEDKYTHPTGIGTALTTSSLKKIKYDAQGHITATSNVNGTDLPSHNHTELTMVTRIQGHWTSNSVQKKIYERPSGGQWNFIDDKISYDGSAITYKNSELATVGDIPSLTNYIQQSQTSGLIKNDGTIDTTSYSTFSGSYADLTNKPSIPTDTSDLTNGAGFITSSAINGKADITQSITDGDTTHSPSGDAIYDALAGKQNISNRVTAWSETPNDYRYPSEKLVKTELDKKIAISSTTGLVKNDGTIDTTSYSTFSGSYNDLSNKPSIPTKTSDLTNDGDGTNVFVKNNDSRLSDSRTPKSHSHGDLKNNGQIVINGTARINRNVVTDADGYITTEVKQFVPSASSTIPSADTQNGSYGSGTDYARANHTHPKSSLYAESSHTHTIGDIGATSEILGVNLWSDDGNYVYMLGDYLIYDGNDTDAIYYKDATDLNNEIATKGDIEDAIGNAIAYINS